MNPYQDHTDTELVALLINSDQKAFETIYRKYVRELYAYVRKRIPVKEDCEEIIHIVFESLWKRRENLGHVTALKPYLYHMVRFQAIHHFRDEAVRRKHEEYFTLFEMVYDSSSEDERKDPLVIRALINAALDQLPERCQQAVKMRLTENLSNDDIARRMNIKKTTVENYMVTAFSHFRSVYRKTLKPT
jgi:RNA polymerase sigma-70 factor (ECF subfamily)